MDESIVKALFIAAGALAAALVITIAIRHINEQNNSTDEVLTEINQQTQALSESNLTALQGDTVLGSEVLSRISAMANDTEHFIVVKNGSGTETSYVYKGCSSSTSSLPAITELMTTDEFAAAVTAAKDPSQTSTYINPKAKFSVDPTNGLVYDTNGTLIGIVFVQN